MAPSVAPHCPLHKSKLLPLALRPTRSSWCSCSSLSSSPARALSLSLSLFSAVLRLVIPARLAGFRAGFTPCPVPMFSLLHASSSQEMQDFLLQHLFTSLTNPCSPRSPGEAVECGGYGLEPWGHATCCKCQCSWGEMTESLCGPGFLLWKVGCCHET